MIVELLYGKSTLPVHFADDLDVTVIAKPPMPVLDDPAAAVQRALATPASCAPLAELARGKRSASILICDITRPVPNGLLLRPIIEALLAAGMDADNIALLVATGLHRPNEGAELEQLVGDPWVLRHVAIANHDAQDDDAHIDLGVTPTRGTPVKLDRRFVDADLRLAVGLVEPHFMAGYSGGRKVVVPGIAHADTIRTLHSARYLQDPRTTQCLLDGNPLHEEQLQIMRLVGDAYAVNTVIDDARQLAFVNFGEIVASHLQAVAFAQDFLTVPVPRRFRTIATSAAGFPLDQTYYQAVKSMVTPLDILEPAGNLLVAAECGEGLGSSSYRASQQRLLDEGTVGFQASFKDKPQADVDEWETQMQLRSQNAARIRLLSKLNDEDQSLTGVECVESLEEVVRQSVAETNDSAVAVIPEGPYVVPYCQQ